MNSLNPCKLPKDWSIQVYLSNGQQYLETVTGLRVALEEDGRTLRCQLPEGEELRKSFLLARKGQVFYRAFVVHDMVFEVQVAFLFQGSIQVVVGLLGPRR